MVITIINAIEEAVEITIETGTIRTTQMKVTVSQVIDYAMQKHAMEDADMLTALGQNQTI